MSRSGLGLALVALFTFSTALSFAAGGKVQHQEEGSKGQGTVARETLEDSAQNKGELKELKKNVPSVTAASITDDKDDGFKHQERYRLRFREKQSSKQMNQHTHRHQRGK